jgi:hypothetical protein
MRAFAIAFAAILVAGLGTAWAFYEVGTAVGLGALAAAVLLILLTSVVAAAMTGSPADPLNLLMNHPHWSVRRTGRQRVDFREFFRALPGLSPPTRSSP